MKLPPSNNSSFSSPAGNQMMGFHGYMQPSPMARPPVLQYMTNMPQGGVNYSSGMLSPLPHPGAMPMGMPPPWGFPGMRVPPPAQHMFPNAYDRKKLLLNHLKQEENRIRSELRITEQQIFRLETNLLVFSRQFGVEWECLPGSNSEAMQKVLRDGWDGITQKPIIFPTCGRADGSRRAVNSPIASTIPKEKRLFSQAK